MAERHTRSKYWQNKPILGGDGPTLRERVESWSRQQIGALSVFDALDEAALPWPARETSEAADNNRQVEKKHLEDMNEKPIRELISQRRQSDRPFAGVSTATLVRRLQQSILSEEAHQQVTQEIARRSDRPSPK